MTERGFDGLDPFDDDELAAPAPSPVSDAAPLEPEDDPLAAPKYAAAEPEPDEELDEPGDGGFSDRDLVVRIWMDGDRLTKVRISPVWFTKLAPKERLEDRFTEALFHHRTATQPLLEEPEPVGLVAQLEALPEEVRAAFDELPGLSRELSVAIEALGSELFEATQRAVEADRQLFLATSREVKGTAPGVTVTVDAWGHTSRIAFDESWLDTAQVGTIVSHVQQAADRAYAAWKPAEAGTAGAEAMQRQELLLLATTAILNPRKERS